METEYRIALHCKTPTGFENYAEFYIGADRAAANRLFRSLRGSSDNVHDGILVMELQVICRGLPLDIQMIRCTLDEITDNCRTISKFAFNSFNVNRSANS